MEDARSSSCWVGLKILKARGDQQRQFGQTDLPLAALLGWLGQVLVGAQRLCCACARACCCCRWVCSCSRSSEEAQLQPTDGPGQDLPLACSLGAAGALLGRCKCSVPTTAAPGGFVLRPRSWHALLLLVFLNSFLGVRLQPRICGTGEGLEQRSDRIPNVWPELRLPVVCGLQKPQTGLSAAAWGAARLLEELRTLGVV